MANAPIMIDGVPPANELGRGNAPAHFYVRRSFNAPVRKAASAPPREASGHSSAPPLFRSGFRAYRPSSRAPATRAWWSVFPRGRKIGRASCSERVLQYVYIPVVAVTLKKKK